MGGVAIRPFILALQFLTVISVAPGLRATEAEMRGAVGFYPLVGLVIGGLLAGFDWACKGIWDPAVTGVLDCAFLAGITRGFHLDGLADLADGLGGGVDAARSLEIMKDSRMGPFGGVAIVLLLMVKGAALVGLSRHAQWEALVLAPCLARLGINILGAASCYARPGGGLGALCVGKGARPPLLLALPVALAASATLLGWLGVGLLLMVALWSLAAAAWFRRRLGGVTGDCLGAHCELTETLVLLLCTGILR